MAVEKAWYTRGVESNTTQVVLSEFVGAECEVERLIPGGPVVPVGPVSKNTSAVPSTERRMSFADIRARRQVKEVKSHVRSSSTPKQDSSSPPVEHPPDNLFDALSSSTEIRTSPERGRGLYAKERFKRSK